MSRLVVAALFSLAMLAQSASAAIITFVVPLDGYQEVNSSGVPGQGDPDGAGTATLMIDDVANTISWNIVVSNITLPPLGAHIHNAAFGVNGMIKVDFSAQLSGTGLADPDLASVLADPTQWYVNIHNMDFPSGAIRGQLGTPVPEPGALALMALAGGALLAAARRRP